MYHNSLFCFSNPIKYRLLLGTKSAVFSVLFIWLYLLDTSCLVLGLAHTDLTRLGFCHMHYVIQKQVYKLYVVAQSCLLSTCTLVLFAKAGYLFFRQRNVIVGVLPSTVNPAEKRRIEKQQKLARILCIVVGVYFLLYIPAIVVIPFTSNTSTRPLVNYLYLGKVVKYSVPI